MGREDATELFAKWYCVPPWRGDTSGKTDSIFVLLILLAIPLMGNVHMSHIQHGTLNAHPDLNYAHWYTCERTLCSISCVQHCLTRRSVGTGGHARMFQLCMCLTATTILWAQHTKLKCEEWNTIAHYRIFTLSSCSAPAENVGSMPIMRRAAWRPVRPISPYRWQTR